MKYEIQKRVSREQFAKACRENKSIAALCRSMVIGKGEALLLERVYDIDLPRKIYKTFDHDEIYETHVKNNRNSSKTAKAMGCHIVTVRNVAREREKGSQ